MTVNGNKAELFDFESREWIEQAEYPYEEKLIVSKFENQFFLIKTLEFSTTRV